LGQTLLHERVGGGGHGHDSVPTTTTHHHNRSFLNVVTLDKCWPANLPPFQNSPPFVQRFRQPHCNPPFVQRRILAFPSARTAYLSLGTLRGGCEPCREERGSCRARAHIHTQSSCLHLISSSGVCSVDCQGPPAVRSTSCLFTIPLPVVDVRTFGDDNGKARGGWWGRDGTPP
jgi:hypothetical protein